MLYDSVPVTISNNTLICGDKYVIYGLLKRNDC